MGSVSAALTSEQVHSSKPRPRSRLQTKLSVPFSITSWEPCGHHKPHGHHVGCCGPCTQLSPQPAADLPDRQARKPPILNKTIIQRMYQNTFIKYSPKKKFQNACFDISEMSHQEYFGVFIKSVFKGRGINRV